MREIEFRAFWRDTLKPIPDFSEQYLIDACNDEVFIVDQYTGLKDKNGVKIFEGDVCRFNTKNGQKKHEQKVIVFWGVDAQFRIVNSNRSAFYMSDSLQLWISYDFEVIGNIHQHKHLL